MNPIAKSKEKLLKTAMTLLWQTSYGAVSVEEICKKSGVNKGSFHHFFKSKSGLIVAAMENQWEHHRTLMDHIFSASVSPRLRLGNYCNAIVRHQKESYETFGKVLGCPFCSVGSEPSTLNEEIRLKANQVNHRTIIYLECLTRDLLAEGAIEAKDTAELARDIQSYVIGTLTQAKIENSLKQVECIEQGITRILGFKSNRFSKNTS